MRSLSPLLVVLALVTSSAARADDAAVRALEQTATALVTSFTAAEPSVRCKAARSGARVLGYRAGTVDGAPVPVWRIVLSTPSGVERTLGLFPRRGLTSLMPDKPVRPLDEDQLVAVGPDVIVVDVPPSPTQQPPALTLEALRAGRALIGRALAPLAPWQRALDPQPKLLEEGLPAGSRAVAYPHFVWTQPPPDTKPNLRAYATRHRLVYDRTVMVLLNGD